MDTPQTPDIYVRPFTGELLKSAAAPETLLPDEVLRDGEGNARLYVYGWEQAEKLEVAVGRGIRQATELHENLRLKTFQAMLQGMRSVVRP